MATSDTGVPKKSSSLPLKLLLALVAMVMRLCPLELTVGFQLHCSYDCCQNILIPSKRSDSPIYLLKWEDTSSYHIVLLRRWSIWEYELAPTLRPGPSVLQVRVQRTKPHICALFFLVKALPQLSLAWCGHPHWQSIGQPEYFAQWKSVQAAGFNFAVLVDDQQVVVTPAADSFVPGDLLPALLANGHPSSCCAGIGATGRFDRGH